jgi:hypothetical protein
VNFQNQFVNYAHYFIGTLDETALSPEDISFYFQLYLTCQGSLCSIGTIGLDDGSWIGLGRSELRSPSIAVT